MISKRILFVSKGEHASPTRYRAVAYFNKLGKNGWVPSHITVHGAFSRFRLLTRALRADVVVVLRKTFSSPYLRCLRLCSKRLVFDLDDTIFLSGDGTPSKNRMNRFRQMTRCCRQIWTGNDYLAEEARRFSPDVFVLPTSLVPDKYAVKVANPSDFLDLVWIGSSSTRKHLELIVPILELFADNEPRFRLKIVADFDLPSKRLKTVAVPWSEKGEAEALVSAHIGIAPMGDNPYTRGKCGLKVLQYMASGLPVITSPAGVNRTMVENGKTGFIAESPEQWISAIHKLDGDPGLRRRMGHAGRILVTEQYSVDVTYRKMVQCLELLFE